LYDGDAYYKIASNLLDEGQFGAPILFTPFNYEKGLVRGVELTLSYDIDNWSFYSNLAAAKAQGKNIVSSQFNFSSFHLDSRTANRDLSALLGEHALCLAMTGFF
jgi:outer membrane receptor for ferrienterochelin and colicins